MVPASLSRAAASDTGDLRSMSLNSPHLFSLLFKQYIVNYSLQLLTYVLFQKQVYTLCLVTTSKD